MRPGRNGLIIGSPLLVEVINDDAMAIGIPSFDDFALTHFLGLEAVYVSIGQAVLDCGEVVYLKPKFDGSAPVQVSP